MFRFRCIRQATEKVSSKRIPINCSVLDSKAQAAIAGCMDIPL